MPTFPHDAASEPTALAYAPPPPVQRRRAFRLALIIGLVLIVGGTAPTWLPPLWTRGRLLYLQHRCMAYEPPPGQVVADWRPSSPRAVVPKDWAAFYALLSPPGFRSDGTVFLHERHTPDGRRRLVAVDMVPVLSSFVGGNHTSTECRVVIPGGVTRAPRTTLGWGMQTMSWPTADVQFLAGTADPADPTHFTFDLVQTGRRITCDGWLSDDETVHVEARLIPKGSGDRHGPPSRPAPLTPAPPPTAPRRTAAP